MQLYTPDSVECDHRLQSYCLDADLMHQLKQSQTVRCHLAHTCSTVPTISVLVHVAACYDVYNMLWYAGWVPPSLSNLQPVNGEVCNKEAQAEPRDTEDQVNLTAAVSNPEATLERFGEPSAQHGLSGLLSYESDSDELADAASSSPSPQEGTSTLGPFF